MNERIKLTLQNIVKRDMSARDIVMIRNYKKHSKFDPVFIPEAFKVLDVSKDGRLLIIVRNRDGKTFRRHPDDGKPFKGQFPAIAERISEEEELKQWHKRFTDCTAQFGEDHHVNENVQELIHTDSLNGQLQNDDDNELTVQPCRSSRQRRPYPKYFNCDFAT